jgi:hypothetical protein
VTVRPCVADLDVGLVLSARAIVAVSAEQVKVVRHADFRPTLAEYGLREVHAVQREEHPLVFSRRHDLSGSADRGPTFRNDTSRQKLGVDVHDAVRADDRVVSDFGRREDRGTGRDERVVIDPRSVHVCAWADHHVAPDRDRQRGPSAHNRVLHEHRSRADRYWGVFRHDDRVEHDPAVSSPISTSPQMTAVGATYADSAMFGETPRCSININDDRTRPWPRQADRIPPTVLKDVQTRTRG